MTTKQRRRAEGRCVDCGRDTGGSRRCRACKAKANERQRRIRAESAPPAKLCSRCSRPARPGRQLCEHHAEIVNRSARTRRSERGRTSCDCGRPLAPQRHACKRCLWLDGRGPAEQEIIGLLREVETATVSMLAAETGRSVDAAEHIICRLRRRGRVVGHYETPQNGDRRIYAKVWRLVGDGEAKGAA